MKNLSSLPKIEQEFIGKYYTKIKDNTELFKILELVHGKESEKLIPQIDKDLADFKIDDIKECLSNSKSKSGEARIFNYQKLLQLYKKDKNFINYSSFLKDNNGYINDKNVNFVQFMSKIISSKNDLGNYANIVKDDNGVIKDDIAEKLQTVINTISGSKRDKINHNNVIYCIEIYSFGDGTSGENVPHLVAENRSSLYPPVSVTKEELLYCRNHYSHCHWF